MRLNGFRIHCLLRALLCALLLGPGAPLGAATDEAVRLLERRVKAALLYRFINYVDWPDTAFATPASAFVIGVVGADTLTAELAEFAVGRTVLNRPLVVRRVKGADDLKDVHILFVGREASPLLPGLLRALPAHSLVVTEWENALRRGSIINFLLVGGQVRFEVSLEAAQRRNIRLSSRLLSVAHQVEQ